MNDVNLKTLRRLRTAALHQRRKTTAMINAIDDLIYNVKQARKQARTPRKPSWDAKAKPGEVIEWLRMNDGTTIIALRNKFDLTDRQWVKLRKVLLRAGCTITGNTNRRTVHAPGGIHAAHD